MNPSVTLLAAALPDHPGFLESVGYQLNGLIVVFTALAGIWLMLEIVGRAFRRAEARAAVPAAPPAGRPVAAAGAPSPEVVAAVAAAAQAALGTGARVTAVVPVPANPWAHEGRREIFTSHHVR